MAGQYIPETLQEYQVIEANSLSFAKKVQSQIGEKLDMIKDKNATPVVMVIGDQHGLGKDATHSPSESLYAITGAIEQAIQRVGKDKVILTVELPNDQINAIKNEWANLSSKEMKLPAETFLRGQGIQLSPEVMGLKHAMQQGIEIYGVDNKRSEQMFLPYGAQQQMVRHGGDYSEAREQEMQKSIKKIADEHPGHIVIHLGGVEHLANFAGYSNTSVRGSAGDVSKLAPPTTVLDKSHTVLVNAVGNKYLEYSEQDIKNLNKPANIAQLVLSDSTTPFIPHDTASKLPMTEGAVMLENALAEQAKLKFSQNPKNAIQAVSEYPEKIRIESPLVLIIAKEAGLQLKEEQGKLTTNDKVEQSYLKVTNQYKEGIYSNSTYSPIEKYQVSVQVSNNYNNLSHQEIAEALASLQKRANEIDKDPSGLQQSR